MKFLLILSGVILSACTTSNSKSFSDVTGTIYLGPEQAVFNFCNDDVDYWLSERTYSAINWETVQAILNSQPECGLVNIPCNWQKADVVGKAMVRADKSGYGHLSGYDAEIIFRNFDKSSATSLCENNG